MEASVIPCVRELNDYHAQVKDISAYADFHAGELRVNRRDLLAAVKQAQELQCFTSIQMCYYLKLTPSNVRDISQLPFMKPNGCSVSDRLVEMARIGSTRSSINKFLKTLFGSHDDLPAIFASIDINRFPETVPYLPSIMKPRDFFTCSSIPAIFGHFWSRELQQSYIQFLLAVGDNIPNINPSTFRNHWLFDSIKYYVIRSPVIQYMRLSIGDLIFKLIRDKEIIELSKGNVTQALFDKLCQYANLMVEDMQANLEIFPNDVKFIMKHFVDKSTNQQDRISWLELLFLDCVLAPSISNLRNYGIIPAAFYIDPSPTGPSRSLNILAQLFRYNLHPQQVNLRYPDIDSSSITSLSLKNFLINLVNVEQCELTGPKLVDLLPLLGIHYILILMSLPDVYMLADAVQRAQNPDQTLSRDASNIPTNESVSFDYFRFDVWDFATYGFKKPKIPENEIEKPPNNLASLAGEALYKFLSYAEVDRKAPSKYSDFTTFHETNMINQRQYVTEAYLRHLYVIYQSIPQKDQRAVIPGLEDEIRRHFELEQRNSNTLTGIAIQMRTLKEEIDRYQNIKKERLQILYSQLLLLYFQEGTNPQRDFLKPEQIVARANEFIQKTIFSEFLLLYFNHISMFITPVADYAVRGVQCCFHSYITQFIPLSKFIEYNTKLNQCDQLLQTITDQSIEKLCISSSPARIRHLFSTQQLFVFPIYAAQKAMFIELPLEAIRQFSIAIKLIKKMFELEIGGKPTQQELQALFDYVVLKSNVPTVFSMGKYLNHFLLGIPIKDNSLFDDGMEDAIHLVDSNLTALESLLSDF